MSKSDEKRPAPVELPSPMANDDTIKKVGHVGERRKAVPSVRMHKDGNEMDVSALDVESHSRMGWKLAGG
jgi:hypothetical protein